MITTEKSLWNCSFIINPNSRDEEEFSGKVWIHLKITIFLDDDGAILLSDQS